MAIFVYLRFRLAETAELQDFEDDMRAMAELAKTQPGYMRSEMGRSMHDQLVYIVVSEWDDIDDVRGWEHNGIHVEIQQKWEPLFGERLVHRRLTPSEKDPGKPESFSRVRVATRLSYPRVGARLVDVP